MISIDQDTPRRVKAAVSGLMMLVALAFGTGTALVTQSLTDPHLPDPGPAMTCDSNTDDSTSMARCKPRVVHR